MKKNLLLCLSLYSCLICFGQGPPQYPNAYESLNINEVNALMLNGGDMCWDLINARYEVPKNSGKHALFAAALWIGGLDNNGKLHCAANTYRQNGIDYWSGPLDTISGTIDTQTVVAYNKIWKINKSVVDSFKLNFLNGNVGNGTFPIPNSILSWPAQASGNYSRDIAPFVDFNQDGIYNPVNGDYPLLKGDQDLFWIFNDAKAFHGETFGLPLGIEVRTTAYAFSCDQIPFTDSDAVLNYTTFFNYKIINRSQLDYHDVYVGIWMDPDLGNPNDDLIGCDSSLNIGFVYNASNNDAGNGINHYGQNPPMLDNLILKGPRAVPNDGIDNNQNGLIDEPGEPLLMSNFNFFENDFSSIGNPQDTSDYYNYLKSVWKDGSHVTHGGNGHGGATPSNYIFSGAPYASNSWTQSNPIDGRAIVSMGPFNLAAGEEQSIDHAFVFSWDSAHANGLTTSIAKNRADVLRVKNWFANKNYPSCLSQLGIESIAEDAFSLFPNPAADRITLVTPNRTFKKYELMDVMGKALKQGEILNQQSIIETLELAPGVYFIRLVGEGSSLVRKFVKQ